jgi:hypothetical protein
MVIILTTTILVEITIIVSKINFYYNFIEYLKGIKFSNRTRP